jgi:hypothetical protein
MPALSLPVKAYLFLKQAVLPTIMSAASPLTKRVSSATPVTISDANSLQGTDVAIATSDDCYVLNGKNGIGFYRYTGANLNPHKVYVIFNGSFAPQRMRFIFQEEQNTTAVDNAERRTHKPH